MKKDKSTPPNQSRYFYTASLMDEALVLLLSKKDFEYITVKEVCLKAGVNRSTFYLHYENTTDLLKECLDKMNESFLSKLEGINKLDIQSSSLDQLLLLNERYLIPYLTFIKENRPFYKAANSKPELFNSQLIFNKLFKDIFNPILIRFGSKDEDNPYIMEFYIKGISGIVMKWVDNGCQEEVEHVEKLIEQCVPISHIGKSN